MATIRQENFSAGVRSIDRATVGNLRNLLATHDRLDMVNLDCCFELFINELDHQASAAADWNWTGAWIEWLNWNTGRLLDYAQIELLDIPTVRECCLFEIRDAAGKTIGSASAGARHPWPYVRGNAHLFAASWQLLAACRTVKAFLVGLENAQDGSDDPCDEQFKMARRRIHAPLHAALDEAIRQALPKGPPR